MKLKWTTEIDNFIRAECPCNDKKALLQLINSLFNTSFTLHALTTNLCSKKIHLGIKPSQNNTGKFRGKEPLPIKTEREKKGYIRIKVAQPDVWKQKQVYIYEQFYKVEVKKEKEIVLFLDGNNRNFNISNLYLIPRTLIGIINGYVKKGDSPEVVKQKIELAKIKNKSMDLATSLGLCVKNTNPQWKSKRTLKTDANRKQKERIGKMSSEEKAKWLKHHYEWYKNRMEFLRISDPKKYQSLMNKKREYSRNYARRKRNEKQTR